MKVTRQIVADKIADYLHGKVSQAELVDWAERAMMEADFDEADTELLADIIGRLGLADVAEFGLRWQDCEEFSSSIGLPRESNRFERMKISYDPEVDALSITFRETTVRPNIWPRGIAAGLRQRRPAGRAGDSGRAKTLWRN